MSTENKIYNSYLNMNKNQLYFRELQELTNSSSSSIQNSLNKLVKSKILEKNKTKSNTFYKIKNKKIFSLKFSEIAYNKFQNLNIGVKIPLSNFISKIPNNIYTVILFGSTSKKEETNKSDIDILIVSNNEYNFNFEKLKKEINISSNYPISIFKCNINEFNENKDQIIIQARKTGFPIYHEQNFYEVILSEL
jgi:predicted nucleotidyltransferase